MADYNFYCHYTKNGASVTDLTVTCTVYRASTGAVVANAQAATEIGSGLYKYPYSSATEDDYVAVFNTAGDVDSANLPALVPLQQPRIDAAVSSRSSHSAADVWAAVSRTLTGFGTLVDEVWDELTSGHAGAGSTGKALADAGAAGDPWSAAVRTLTSSAAQTAAAVEGDTLTGTRGDVWSFAITGLGSLTGYTAIDFTAKIDTGQPDSAAALRVRLSSPAAGTDGLQVLNGGAATAAWGSIAVDDADAGNVTITVAGSATASIAPASYCYDIQQINATGPHTLTSGTLVCVADVTRAIA